MADNFTPEQIEQFLQEFFTVVGRRQYIGARYVPMFGRKDESSIEWDNSAPYEPLTIVIHNGNSFTSKQFVPIGIDITNTEYWVNTGNYNVQVEQYRQEVANFSESIIEKQFAFNTVADMKNSTNLYDGAICHTCGFYNINDGGAAYYKISFSGNENNMDVIKCGSLYAHLIIPSKPNPEIFGAKGDGTTDDTTIIQYVTSKYSMYCKKNYLITDTIFLTHDVYMDCNSKFILRTTNIGIVLGDSTAQYDPTIKYQLEINLNIDGKLARGTCVCLNNVKRSNIHISSIECECILFSDKYNDAGSNYENKIKITGYGAVISGTICADLYGGDNTYPNIEICNFETAVKLNTPTVQDIGILHPWLNSDGYQLWENSKVIDSSAVNDSPKIVINHLYCDTYRYCFYVNKIFAAINLFNVTINATQIPQEVLTNYPHITIYTTGTINQPSIINASIAYFLNNEISFNNRNYTILNLDQNSINTGGLVNDVDNIPLGNQVFQVAQNAENLPTEYTFTSSLILKQITTIGQFTEQIIYGPSDLVYIRRRAYWGSWSAWHRIVMS